MSHKHNLTYGAYRELLGLSSKAKPPRVVLLANAEDERTGDAFEVFAFQKPAGRHGTERVPRERAFNASTLASALIAKNGLLPRKHDDAVTCVVNASERDPTANWLYVKTDGWQDRHAFSHGGKVFGSANQNGLMLKPPLADQQRVYPLSKRGRADRWVQVMRLARHSTRLRLALCAAFAAPLLKIVDLQSFTLVLAGPSKAGKSSALIAAGSVIGLGREGALPNFNATDPALQQTAIEFTDRVLPVNEVGLMAGSRKNAYQELRPLTYLYAEGRDRVRHSKSVYASQGGPLEWRGIMLISSENTFESLAEMAGEKRDEGEWARAFDVPATRGNNKTIFDSYPRWVAEEDRERWAREQLRQLRELCRDHHGHAFETYVGYLLENRADLRRRVTEAMGEFLAEVADLQLSGALQHAARNFALLYAGAVLANAARLGVTWNLPSALAALKLCFLDGLGEIRRVEAIQDRAKSILVSRLRVLRRRGRTAEPDKAGGWVNEQRDQKTFCIRSSAFADWFGGDKAQVRAAIKLLHEADLLILKDGAKPSFPNTEWAVTFAKFEGKSTRCYQIRDSDLLR